MNRFPWTFWFAIGIACLPATAFAVQITPIVPELFPRRIVRVHQQQCLAYEQQDGEAARCVSADTFVASDSPAPGELVFEAQVSLPGMGAPFAEQSSEIGPTLLRGSGSITMEDVLAPDPDTFATTVSRFGFAFSTDEEAVFRLTAILERPQVRESPPIGGGGAYLEFCRLAFVSLIATCTPRNRVVAGYFSDILEREVTIDYTGTFPAGNYMLVLEAGGSNELSLASWSFELEVASVPEPATLLLLFAGLSAAAAARGVKPAS